MAEELLQKHRMIEPVRHIEEVDIVLIDEATLRETEQWLSACEVCAENATISLDCLFDALMGCDPTMTEYVMCRPACCPSCSTAITEKTRVAA